MAGSEDGDPSQSVIEYRMKVHLFGAGSSPGCANFALKKAADDGEEEFGTEAAEFIRNDFYVDDGLTSVPTVDEAVELMKASQKICAKAGLKLHKLVSNKREVLEAFPTEERAKAVQDLDLEIDVLPLERVLGVTWCIQSDSFQFRVELQDRPVTRRGILSTVSSIYDPTGFVAPFTLKGKQILQELCRDKLDWDSPIPEDLKSKWEKWRTEVLDLEKIEVSRCYKPNDFGTVKAVELHHFSDASVGGYGQCSYVRLVNQQDKTHCSFVMGKARVTPLKQLTIPKLELAAAVLSARISDLLRSELTYNLTRDIFWTDSKVVLGYVKNESRRFHVYVANRVQQIRDLSRPDAWRYVKTDENPADEASRGKSPKQLIEESQWLRGPAFLWRDGVFEDLETEDFQLDPTDPEVKKVGSFKTSGSSSAGLLKSDRFKHFSSWSRARRVVALCLRLKARLKERSVKNCKSTSTSEPGASSLTVAEIKGSGKSNDPLCTA